MLGQVGPKVKMENRHRGEIEIWGLSIFQKYPIMIECTDLSSRTNNLLRICACSVKPEQALKKPFSHSPFEAGLLHLCYALPFVWTPQKSKIIVNRPSFGISVWPSGTSSIISHLFSEVSSKFKFQTWIIVILVIADKCWVIQQQVSHRLNSTGCIVGLWG